MEIAALLIIGITLILMIISVVLNLKTKFLHLPLYWVITLLGALFAIFFKIIPFNEVINIFTKDTAINPIKILILFISMTTVSIFLDEVGFFKFLAMKVLIKAGKKQLKLFILLYLTVSILTIFTSNDIIILTFTPFICYFCKNAKIDPIPYLIEEFVAANTFSMVFLIGNPTNIYLSLSQNINFISYFKIMLLPSLAAGITAFIVMYLIFRKKLQTEINPLIEEVKINKTLTIIGCIILLTCTAFLIISDYLKIEMYLVSFISSVILILSVLIYSIFRKEGFKPLTKTIKRLPWGLIPFMISMFILVAMLDYNGITKIIGNVLNNGNQIYIYGITSTIACNLINNIPMSVLYASTITNIGASLKATFATIIGSNIGAYLTPIGALAGIMWSNILKTHNVKMNYARFIIHGSIIALPTLLIALFVLNIIL